MKDWFLGQLPHREEKLSLNMMHQGWQGRNFNWVLSSFPKANSKKNFKTEEKNNLTSFSQIAEKGSRDSWRLTEYMEYVCGLTNSLYNSTVLYLNWEIPNNFHTLFRNGCITWTFQDFLVLEWLLIWTYSLCRCSITMWPSDSCIRLL